MNTELMSYVDKTEQAAHSVSVPAIDLPGFGTVFIVAAILTVIIFAVTQLTTTRN